MYAWIWRHLPFGLPGKIIGSLVLLGALAALLWFVVFPWAQPLLPFDDVQVTDTGTTDGGAGVDAPTTGDDDIPYDTETNNPAPSPTAGR